MDLVAAVRQHHDAGNGIHDELLTPGPMNS